MAVASHPRKCAGICWFLLCSRTGSGTCILETPVGSSIASSFLCKNSPESTLLSSPGPGLYPAGPRWQLHRMLQSLPGLRLGSLRAQGCYSSLRELLERSQLPCGIPRREPSQHLLLPPVPSKSGRLARRGFSGSGWEKQSCYGSCLSAGQSLGIRRSLLVTPVLRGLLFSNKKTSTREVYEQLNCKVMIILTEWSLFYKIEFTGVLAALQCD